MTDSLETKVCPACAETIRAAANICPHCRHTQKFLSWRNPNTVGTVYVLIMLIVLVAAGIFLDRMINEPKHEFSAARDRVETLQSSFSFQGSDTNLVITVVGVLTNGGNSSWKDIGLEARFFNAAGNLIDVVSRSGDYVGDAVLKHNEVAFKIKGFAAKPESEYATHKVSVIWAKSADTWP